MKKKQTTVWVYKAQTPKFTAGEKAELLSRIKTIIEKLPKLSKKVSRLDIRANRVYLYELVEQFIQEGVIYTKPLIEDKYLEFPYARITLNDSQGESCTLDWQRHNSQWITLDAGTLEECLNAIEKDGAWF